MIPPRAQPDALVTVLIPTYNRLRYLPQAVQSVLNQTYPHLQVLVVNDGGPSVREIVSSFNDPRLTLLERKDNRGKAASLNQALQYARGRYVCYLDDDDLYYPHHVGRLVETLETSSCGVAYSDLYKVHCRILPDGRRQVLGKVVNISRDFDRFLMMYFNHVLHVSLMHRRDLLDKTGPYNESVRVLIDWDMTRRLAFYSDFEHITDITGEFFGPVGECDRTSYRMRLDANKYLANVLAIRTSRPPKPWPRMKDLSIILPLDALDTASADRIRHVWALTFWPYQLYLAMPGDQLARLDTQMPNVVRVPTPAGATAAQQVDAALRFCDSEFTAVLRRDTQPGELWIEPYTYALEQSSRAREGIRIGGNTDTTLPAVFRTDELRKARNARPELDLERSLSVANIKVRSATDKEMPLQFDSLLFSAQSLEKDGSWSQAAEVYDQIRRRHPNRLWMDYRHAHALYHANNADARLKDLTADLNRRRPTVDTLLLQARVLRRVEDTAGAVALLRKAKQILDRKG